MRGHQHRTFNKRGEHALQREKAVMGWNAAVERNRQAVGAMAEEMM